MDVMLVVLYKQNVFESTTLQSLVNCKNQISDKHLFVWDNSPISLEQKDILFLEKSHPNLTYFHSKNNTSLSKLYNKVIRDKSFDKIFIFDQDTTVTSDYFEKIDEAASKFINIGVFLPFVKFNNNILSPMYYKVVNLKKESKISFGMTLAKNRTAFASGLCIKEWVFKKEFIWFDEYLSFYGIDYKFMLDYGDRVNHFYVVNYELNHSLAFTEKESKEIKIRRFSSSIFSSFYLARKRLNISEKVILVIRAFFSSIKMAIQFRSIVFINIFFRNVLNIVDRQKY